MAVATSIVDFLKKRGLKPEAGEKFPFFEQRGQLFNRMGLGTDMGEFRGTAEQNTALLQSLRGAEKSTGISITPENLFDVAMVGMGGGTAQLVPLQPTPIEQPTAVQPTPTEAQQLVPTPITPVEPAVSPAITGTTAESLLPQIPGAGDVAQQALEQVQRGATFPLQQEAVTAEKEAIRLGAQRQKESFIQQIASRGLFFSGAKTKGLRTVEADQLSQILGVDRSFALLIAQGLETAAQDIVKEAQKGRTEAINSLQALGYAINPITGKVEPTVAARQVEVTQERLEAQRVEQVRQFGVSQAATQERFEVTEERLAAQQEVAAAQTAFSQAVTLDQRRVAQENLQIAQRRLALEEQKAQVDVDVSQITGPQDLSQLARAVYDRTINLTDITPTQRAEIAPELNAVGFTAALKAEDQQSLTFIKNQMNDVMTKWEAVPDMCKGSIQGTFPVGPVDPFQCRQDENVSAFDTSVGFVSQTLARLVENGRLTDKDREFYRNLMPNRLIQDLEAAKAAGDNMQRLLKEKLETDTGAIEKDIIDATQADTDYVKSLKY